MVTAANNVMSVRRRYRTAAAAWAGRHLELLPFGFLRRTYSLGRSFSLWSALDQLLEARGRLLGHQADRLVPGLADAEHGLQELGVRRRGSQIGAAKAVEREPHGLQHRRLRLVPRQLRGLLVGVGALEDRGG